MGGVLEPRGDPSLVEAWGRATPHGSTVTELPVKLEVRAAPWLRGFVFMTTVASLVMLAIAVASNSSGGYVVGVLLTCLFVLTLRMQLLRFLVEEESITVINPFRSYRLHRRDVLSLTISDGEYLWIGPILVRGILSIQKAVIEVRGRRDVHVVVLDWTDDEQERSFGVTTGWTPPDLGAMRLLLFGDGTPQDGQE